MYLKSQETYRKDRDVKTKITQLYTNRSLSYHQLGNQAKALEDAEHVLGHLDKDNGKALFRRGYANKTIGKYEEAVKDL
jgi:tetratricopeptide (TPR) repeat protein